MHALRMPELPVEPLPSEDAQRLLGAMLELSGAREMSDVAGVVRRAARALTHADGVTFVLPEGELVHYADEDAIAPLWKGRRFPRQACISGWAMMHRQTVVLEDIYADARIPADAYRPTFVKSLAMVPVRPEDPVGAIGAYWAQRHRATRRELALLEALAGATAVAMANVKLLGELREAVRMRDEFITIAAHELRTPLTPLAIQAEVLGRVVQEEPVASATREASQRIGRHVARLRRLVSNLLDVSRVTQGALALEPQELDLAELVREVAGQLSADLETSGSTLQVRAEHPVRGRWDRVRLEQVVTNLLANAIKYGAKRPIEVSVAADQQRACLVVRDHGMGIAPEDQERIFGRFERAVSSRHFGGFGVGLWLVRRIVEAHLGSVQVHSIPGEGSTFRVLLPR